MRILLVHDYGADTGGAEHQILTLRELFRRRGHDARLFSSTARYTPAPLLADYRCFGVANRFQSLVETTNPAAYAKLRAALAEFEPDIVHVRMFLTQLSPLILPLLAERPAVYQTSTYECVCPTGRKMFPDGRLCDVAPGRACLRHGCVPAHVWPAAMLQQALWRRWRPVFDRVAALSDRMKERLRKAGVEGPIEVIHNGVEARPPRPPLSDPPLVFYAGRFAPEKGVAVLLEAMARVIRQRPDVRLELAGGGPEESQLRQRAQELGLESSVRFLGSLPRPELEAACNRAWVQAAPSLWEEPFGNVATEAAIRGTAMVATSSGGFAEIVQDGVSGFLTPAGDAAALARALERVVADREIAERLGQGGRRIALERFTTESCAQRFEDLYRDVVAAYSPHRS